MRLITSDNGTNFVGTKKELSQTDKIFSEIDVHKWLRGRGIEWKFNPPTHTHFGGIWEC